MSKGITVFVSTNLVGSKTKIFYSWDALGITEREFDAMKLEEREKFVFELVNDCISWGFYKTGERNGWQNA